MEDNKNSDTPKPPTPPPKPPNPPATPLPESPMEDDLSLEASTPPSAAHVSPPAQEPASPKKPEPEVTPATELPKDVPDEKPVEQEVPDTNDPSAISPLHDVAMGGIPEDPPPVPETKPAEKKADEPHSQQPSKEALKKSHTGIIIAAAIITAVIAALVAAYFLNLLPIPPFFLSKDRVLQNMMQAVGTIESATYTITYEADMEPHDPGVRPMDPNLLGPSGQVLHPDQQRLDDAFMLLQSVQAYKDGPAADTYPETLLQAVPQEHEARINEALMEGIYGYRQEEGGEAFLLNIELTSQEAVTAYFEAAEGNVTTRGTIISLNQDSLPVAAAVHSTPPPETPFVSFLLWPTHLDNILAPNLSLRLMLQGAAALEPGQPIAADYTMDASLQTEDITLSAQADVIQKDDTQYIRFNDITPERLFPALTEARGSWMEFLPQRDLPEFFPESTTGFSESTRDLLQHMHLALQIAAEEDVIVIAEELPQEAINGRRIHRYMIQFDREAIPQFYRRFTQEAERTFNSQALVEFDPSYYEYLLSDSFTRAFNIFQENTSIEIWIEESTFYPIRLSYTHRQAFPESRASLAGYQLVSTAIITLQNINGPVTVLPPDDYSTFGEAATPAPEDELPGHVRQTNQVQAIRSALMLHYLHTGRYPDTLADLQKRPSELETAPVPVKEEEYDAALLRALQESDDPFLASIPDDVFTQGGYHYVSHGNDYELVYLMQLSDPDTQEQAEYAEGVNTATASQVSREAAQ